MPSCTRWGLGEPYRGSRPVAGGSQPVAAARHEAAVAGTTPTRDGLGGGHGLPPVEVGAGLMLARSDPRRRRPTLEAGIWSSGTAALTAPAPSGRRTLVGLESEPIGTRSAGA